MLIRLFFIGESGLELLDFGVPFTALADAVPSFYSGIQVRAGSEGHINPQVDSPSGNRASGVVEALSEDFGQPGNTGSGKAFIHGQAYLDFVLEAPVAAFGRGPASGQRLAGRA